MTTFRKKQLTCACCGQEQVVTVLGSTNAFGSMDLDTRPPGMQRRTMPMWVQECEACGYVSTDLTQCPEEVRPIVASDDYKNCGGIASQLELCRRFVKHAILCAAQGEKINEIYAYLHGAWVCDDAREKPVAKQLREKAAALIDALDETEKDENLRVLQADLLRRSEQYERLISEYENQEFSKDLLTNIIAFQLNRARARDNAVYTVAKALGEQ